MSKTRPADRPPLSVHGDVEAKDATHFCVLQIGNYRLLYLGCDFEQATAVMSDATLCAGGRSTGDAQRNAAMEVGRVRRKRPLS